MRTGTQNRYSRRRKDDPLCRESEGVRVSISLAAVGQNIALRALPAPQLLSALV